MAVLLLAGIAFGHTKANAADDFTWEYDAAADKLTLTPAEGVTLKYYQLGKKDSASIKPDKLVAYDAAKGIVPSDNKIKLGNVANYYVVNAATAASGSSAKISASANVKLKAQTDKIKAVNIAYFAAIPSGTAATVTDVDLISVTAKTAGTVSAGAVEVKLSENGEYKLASELTTGDLYTLVTGTKVKILVRLAGVSGSTDVATRPSADKKVSIKAAKELKKVKVDFVKGTIAVKNGFDYFVSSTEVSDPETGAFAENVDLITVLPFNKNGTVTSPTAISFSKYLNGEFKLVAKPQSSDMGYYTKEKVKQLAITEYGYWYVRKSATAKGPATKFCKVGEIKAPDVAPVIDASKVSVSSKGAIKIDGFSTEVEFAILKNGQVNEADGKITIDLSLIKWTKFKNDKTKNTAKSTVNKEKNTYGANNYIAFRVGGVKNSKLPSNYVVFKINADGWTKLEAAAAESTENNSETGENNESNGGESGESNP